MSFDFEDRVLIATGATASRIWQTARLSARVLILTTVLVAISMGLAYLAFLLFVANSNAISFAWGWRHYIDTPVLDRYHRDRNLFLAIGAAAGLVVSFGVNLTLAIQSAVGKSDPESPTSSDKEVTVWEAEK